MTHQSIVIFFNLFTLCVWMWDYISTTFCCRYK